MLDMKSSPFHLKLKYHNFHEDSMTICVDLYGTRRIHNALHCDQKEDGEKAMEINVASLVMSLRDMVVNPLIGQVNKSSLLSA